MQGKTETRVGIFVLAALGIFIYMGFQIGAFRFDRWKYNTYLMYFKDTSGLLRKADVKIAGVKVGWVEQINLQDDTLQAEATVMIRNNYNLYTDACAIVRQDGLLGPKFIEIIPGNSNLRSLESGEALTRLNTESSSLDELIQQLTKVASNMQIMTESFKEVLGGVEGKEHLQVLFDNLQNTAEKISSFSNILEHSFTRNENNLDNLLQVGTTINRLTHKLEQEVFPSVQDSINKISNTFDRDFNRVADKIESTACILEEASIQARDSLRNVCAVAEKIDDGSGVVGKLLKWFC